MAADAQRELEAALAARVLANEPADAPPDMPPLAVNLETESRWDKEGCTALKRALVNTKLADAAWLAELAESNGILPRCQDLPAAAMVSLAQMEAWDEKYTVGVLVIS